MLNLNIDISHWCNFFDELGVEAETFKKEISKWMEGIGEEFLDIVKEQIISYDAKDTGKLFDSFEKGNDGNVFIISNNGFTLEVGTNIDYATYVNDGHWTCEKGSIGRWVPGEWVGNKFNYIPGAKTGMYLKQQWVDGKPYFDEAFQVLEKLFPDLMEAKFENLLAKWV